MRGPFVGLRLPGPDRGTSFAEIAIALFLLAVVIVGISPLFLSSSKSNEAAHEAARASWLARDRLEDLVGAEFGSPLLSTGAHEDTLAPTLPDPRTGGHPSGAANPFVRRWRVRQYAMPPAATVPRDGPLTPMRIRAAGSRYDFKRVDVTVETRLSRPELGLLAVRVSAVRGNPSPEAILSEDDPDP